MLYPRIIVLTMGLFLIFGYGHILHDTWAQVKHEPTLLQWCFIGHSSFMVLMGIVLMLGSCGPKHFFCTDDVRSY